MFNDKPEISASLTLFNHIFMRLSSAEVMVKKQLLLLDELHDTYFNMSIEKMITISSCVEKADITFWFCRSE